VKSTLTELHQASIRDYAQRYVEYKNVYAKEVTSGE
jgi:hypothetical protein